MIFDNLIQSVRVHQIKREQKKQRKRIINRLSQLPQVEITKTTFFIV